jgi:hypothetical protein
MYHPALAERHFTDAGGERPLSHEAERATRLSNIDEPTILGHDACSMNPRAGQRPLAPLLLPWAPLRDALRRFGARASERHMNSELQGT